MPHYVQTTKNSPFMQYPGYSSWWPAESSIWAERPGFLTSRKPALTEETGTETAMAMGTVMAPVILRAGVLAAAAILLTGCAPADSERGEVRRPCPSLVEYDAEFRERAASEIERLPEHSPIVAMLSDYAAMREQARACRGLRSGS